MTVRKKFERLVRRVCPQARLLRWWRLEGGISARAAALEVSLPDGRTRRMVVHRHGARDLEQNPCVAADEFRLLRITQSLGLPTPVPYHLDQSGEIFPTPYVVVEYIEGRPEFTPSDTADFVLQLAAQLAAIHDADCSEMDLSFLSKLPRTFADRLAQRPPNLDESLSEGRIRDTLESVWPLPARNEPALLHGDFWPGNVLWSEGRLVAVIDWEDAKLGDPLADLANSRLETLWAFGIGAMNDLTNHYRSMTRLDFTDLAYWDLCAALFSPSNFSEMAAGWKEPPIGRSDVTAETMRQAHGFFVDQAFEQLSAR